jgi:hypothetical protein
MLPVSLLSAVSLAAFVFKYDNFFGLVLFDDKTIDLYVVQIGLPNGDIVSLGHHQYIFERHRPADLPVDFLKSAHVADPDFVLFTPRRHYCIHGIGLLDLNSRWLKSNKY